MEYAVKKFSALIICLLLILTCTLTGCAGFSVDRVKYYNEVVATVGDYEITRFELLNSYNSYNQYAYMQSEEQDESEAMKETLNLLIDREALYQYAESFKLADGTNPYTPAPFQINDIVQAIFDSLDSQIETYINSAKRVLGIKEKAEEQEDEESATAYPYADYAYKKRATVSTTTETVYYTDADYKTEASEETPYVKTREVNKISYITPYKDEPENWKPLVERSLLTNFKDKALIEAIKNNYLAHLKEDLQKDEGENATAIYNHVLKSLSESLINYEYYLRDKNGKPYNKVTNDLLFRYFERTYNSQLKSKYLANVQEYYLVNENLSTDELLIAFKQLMQANIDEFDLDASSYKSKMKSISTKGDTVLYHPTTDTQFGYFYHILFQFDDDADDSSQKVDYKDKSLTDILSTTAPVRDNEGKEAGTVTLEEFLDSPEFTKLQTASTYEERLSRFIDLMFKYTEDTATLATGMPYVVGSYDAANGETYSQNSSMVEEFTNEAIKLMQNEKGALSAIDAGNKNSMCVTEYGVHILFYVGNVNAYDVDRAYMNEAFIKDEDPNYANDLNLYCKEINPFTHKTYFDMLFDTVYPASSSNSFTSNTSYSYEEEVLVSRARNRIADKIVIHDDKLAGTKTKI